MMLQLETISAECRSLGIFGGTFDPVHHGHLILAERALEALALDQILFMPAGIPPHKRGGAAISPAADRVAMLKRAVYGNSRMAVSEYEIMRSGISYTADTLDYLHSQLPTVDLCLIIGADNARDFRHWRKPDDIARRARIAVLRRPGETLPTIVFPGADVMVVDAPLLDISSTEIRSRAASGRSIRYLVPENVAEYIAANALYSV
jgi:nicotinate-nucleotide adenylyltransferase